MSKFTIINGVLFDRVTPPGEEPTPVESNTVDASEPMRVVTRDYTNVVSHTIRGTDENDLGDLSTAIPFASTEEQMRWASDPRYKRDADFRREYNRRCFVTR